MHKTEVTVGGGYRLRVKYGDCVGGSVLSTRVVFPNGKIGETWVTTVTTVAGKSTTHTCASEKDHEGDCSDPDNPKVTCGK
jgi:hypothetical protein